MRNEKGHSNEQNSVRIQFREAFIKTTHVGIKDAIKRKFLGKKGGKISEI